MLASRWKEPFHWMVVSQTTVLYDIDRVRFLEIVTSVVCVVSSPSHLRCRDFRSDVRSGADGTNAFVSSSLNPQSISASHTTMAPRPPRPVTPEEVENRRKRDAERKRLERERKRRRLDHEEESREQESRHSRSEQLRQQKATYQRDWLQTSRDASRNPSPETLSAISPETVENDGRVPDVPSPVAADVPAQEPQDVPPNHFRSIDTAPTSAIQGPHSPATMARPTARPSPAPRRHPPPIPPVWTNSMQRAKIHRYVHTEALKKPFRLVQGL